MRPPDFATCCACGSTVSWDQMRLHDCPQTASWANTPASRDPSETNTRQAYQDSLSQRDLAQHRDDASVPAEGQGFVHVVTIRAITRSALDLARRDQSFCVSTRVLVQRGSTLCPFPLQKKGWRDAQLISVFAAVCVGAGACGVAVAVGQSKVVPKRVVVVIRLAVKADNFVTTHAINLTDAM